VDRNKAGEEICEQSDVPQFMCHHCRMKTDEAYRSRASELLVAVDGLGVNASIGGPGKPLEIEPDGSIWIPAEESMLRGKFGKGAPGYKNG
jgi:hypothetical protein